MKTTEIKSSAFRMYFSNRIRQSRTMFSVLMLLQMLGLPLMAALSAFISHFTNDDLYEEAYELYSTFEKLKLLSVTVEVISALSFAAAVTAGFFIPFISFRYLHSRTESDKYLALPLTRTQLFTADCLSGLAVYIIPFLVSAALTVLIILFTPEHSFHLVSPGLAELTSLREMNTTFRPGILNMYDTISIIQILKLILLAISFMLLVWTFTALTAVLCGNLFDAVIYLVVSCLLSAAFPAALRLLTELSVINNFTREENILYEAARISPAGTVMVLFESAGNYEWRFLLDFEFSGILKNIWLHILIISAVYLLITWKIFCSRKAEKTSAPFASDIFFYTVSALVTCTVTIFIFAVFSGFSVYSIAGSLLISAFLFAAMTAVKSRGIHIRHPLRQLIFFALSFAVSAGLCTAAGKTNAFGMTFAVPAESSIESAGIFFSEISEEVWSPFSEQNTYDSQSNPEAIREITRLNRELCSDIKMLSDYDYSLEKYYSENKVTGLVLNPKYKLSAYPSDRIIRIRYNLKNGMVYDRLYYPTNARYWESPLFTVPETNLISYDGKEDELLFSFMNSSENLFCGCTDFADKIYPEKFAHTGTARANYPVQYRISEYNEDILYEICNHLQLDYVSEEKSFVFLSDMNCRYYLPYKYADLYTAFLNSGTLEELEWIPEITEQE